MLPGYRIVDSSRWNDSYPGIDFPASVKPDVSVYREEVDLSVRTDSSLAEIFIEFKWKPAEDPFNVPKGVNGEDVGFIHKTATCLASLGQISCYAAAQLNSQFRTHAYSVFIVKNLARIIRWDRSGAIVTEPIDYSEDPLLANFFRRYSLAPSAMRGIDQTVSAPTAEEALVARTAMGLRDVVPLVKLGIPINADASDYFIAPIPRSIFYAPPGRATRGLRAYDLSRKTLCFVKDTWRIDLPDIQAEGLTYKTLNGCGVKNIPNCVAFGDISTETYHATKTSIYPSHTAYPRSPHLIPHRHYRLALDVVGRSLTEFKSSYEMVSAVRDAIIGKLNDQIADEQH